MLKRSIVFLIVLVPLYLFAQNPSLEKLKKNPTFKKFQNMSEEEQENFLNKRIEALKKRLSKSPTWKSLHKDISRNKSILLVKGNATIEFKNHRIGTGKIAFSGKPECKRFYNPEKITCPVLIHVDKNPSTKEDSLPYLTRILFLDPKTGKTPKIEIKQNVKIGSINSTKKYKEKLSNLLGFRYLPTRFSGAYKPGDQLPPEYSPVLIFREHLSLMGTRKDVMGTFNILKTRKTAKGVKKKKLMTYLGYGYGGSSGLNSIYFKGSNADRWSEKQIEWIYEAVSSSPAFDFLELKAEYVDEARSDNEKNAIGSYVVGENKVEFDSDVEGSFEGLPKEESFKAHFIHELVHKVQYKEALEYAKDKYEGDDLILKARELVNESDLVKDYARATMDEHSDSIDKLGWKAVKDKDGNIKYESTEGKTPTSYGLTDILEDMADTAALYFTNPDFLKRNFPERFKFCEKYFSKRENEPVLKLYGRISFNSGALNYLDSYEITIENLTIERTRFYKK